MHFEEKHVEFMIHKSYNKTFTFFFFFFWGGGGEGGFYIFHQSVYILAIHFWNKLYFKM